MHYQIEAERYWILDPRYWIKIEFLNYPASSDQHLASAYSLHKNLIQKLDIKFKISAYKDVYISLMLQMKTVSPLFIPFS